jgi:hypothetical protein
MKMKKIASLSLLAAFAAASPASAIQPSQSAAPSSLHDPAARLAAQREAMQALAFLDGVWRGPAQTAEADGELVQTERVGTLLDGTVRLVEGRGYDASGETVFNALGIITYDPARRVYSMRSYAMGYAGDYPLTIRPDGFGWSRPAGPGATMRYTATVRDGEWHEIGERITDDAAPVRVLEMRLRRIGASEWPATEPVPLR